MKMAIQMFLAFPLTMFQNSGQSSFKDVTREQARESCLMFPCWAMEGRRRVKRVRRARKVLRFPKMMVD